MPEVLPSRQLHALGQSLWLDNLTRELLDSGRLRRYIDERSITGLTSNPTIFDHAIKGSGHYDDAIRAGARSGRSGEALFFDLAIDDIRRAADLFAAVHERTHGIDGWVSLEVSPLLAYDTPATIAAARELHARVARPNLFIKIPGTRQGLAAIEESIFAGVPINVTLLFSAAQYLASAQAWLRGIERRIDAGLSPWVPSVASIFVSRWDVAVAGKAPDALRMKLGIAAGRQACDEYRRLLASPRWQRAMNHGAPPQRLLFASTGTKDPTASATLYVEAFAEPFTIDTLPEATLDALDALDHPIAPPTARAEASIEMLRAFEKAGIDIDALAAKLQADGATAFDASWKELLDVISAKGRALA
ncbi:MAG TPA: transaldolase [Burkholderiaceae bacterium]|nr:transaldolase [Burkholderiaceae bacterium]